MSEIAGTKRGNDGGNSWDGGKKMRGDSCTMRFLLVAKHAGGIIGKGGETIKRLRSEFSANVTVPDTNTNERVLTIIADQENCLKVLRECLPLVHEAPYPVPGRKDEDGSSYEIDFLVHQSQVGGIIGKAGYKIKQIREETGAKVKAYAECLPDSTERVVAIAGTEDQLTSALDMMLKVIDENPIKGQSTPYDPSYDHGTNFNIDSYNPGNNNFNGPPGPRGGMRGGRGGGGRGGGGRGAGGRGGRGGGGGGGYGGPQGGYGGMGQQQDYGNYNNDYNSNWNQGPQGDYGYGGNGGGNYGGGNYGGPPQGGPPQGGNNSGPAPLGGMGGGQNSTQVTVPNDMAGAIIGKGGERIRSIRQKCQADIKFSDPEPGKADRLITISGSHDQIQYAQYLMQQCVRDNHSGSNNAF